MQDQLIRLKITNSTKSTNEKEWIEVKNKQVQESKIHEARSIWYNQVIWQD